MKIVLITTYEETNEDFIKWYIERLKMSKIPVDLEAFKNGERVSFTTSTEDGIATTSYEIIR